MKTLYLECNMGAAGDMLMSALLELHPEPDEFMERLEKLAIPGVKIEKKTEKKCGITGTHIKVSVHGVEENEHIFYDHEEKQDGEGEHQHSYERKEEHQHSHRHNHHHSGMKELENIILKLHLPENVHDNVMSVYRLIAEAESKVHNCEITDIHFHEVGTMDAVVDIVGVCMLMDELGVDEIMVSPINVGKGQVTCAHGILPVPAPATAFILQDVPVYSNEISGELCTPTGAALLKHFASKFTSMPVMKVKKIGYGMGTKDFEAANCVRAFLGETEEEDKTDQAAELVCNLDDMSGERIGFAINRLFEGGAIEVFTTPIGMKKNRPGVMLTCLCTEDKKEKMIRLMFQHTTTIGIRENSVKRYVLNRTEETLHTKYGDVRVKKSSGYGVARTKAEYDDMEKIAIENKIDISEIQILDNPPAIFPENRTSDFNVKSNSQASDTAASEEICTIEKTDSTKIDTPDTETSDQTKENEIYAQLERFYDADSYQEKLDILMPLRGKLTDVMLTNIAVSLDITAQEENLEDRFLSIVSCLETLRKYQSSRLR